MRLASTAVVFTALILAWWALARVVPIVPEPSESIRYMAANWRLLAGDMLVTLENTLAGFLIALAAALATASLMLTGRWAENIIAAVNVVSQSISALIWAIIFLLAFGVTSRLPSIGVAAATAYPILLSGAVKGFEVSRSEYGELTQILGMGRGQEIRHILLPASIPFMVASGRSALGSALRISVVAEALGGSGGLGYRIWTFYEVHEYSGLFAWSLALVVLMVLLDKLVLEKLEVWSRRWAG